MTLMDDRTYEAHIVTLIIIIVLCVGIFVALCSHRYHHRELEDKLLADDYNHRRHHWQHSKRTMNILCCTSILVGVAALLAILFIKRDEKCCDDPVVAATARNILGPNGISSPLNDPIFVTVPAVEGDEWISLVTGNRFIYKGTLWNLAPCCDLPPPRNILGSLGYLTPSDDLSLTNPVAGDEWVSANSGDRYIYQNNSWSLTPCCGSGVTFTLELLTSDFVPFTTIVPNTGTYFHTTFPQSKIPIPTTVAGSRFYPIVHALNRSPNPINININAESNPIYKLYVVTNVGTAEEIEQPLPGVDNLEYTFNFPPRLLKHNVLTPITPKPFDADTYAANMTLFFPPRDQLPVNAGSTGGIVTLRLKVMSAAIFNTNPNLYKILTPAQSNPIDNQVAQFDFDVRYPLD